MPLYRCGAKVVFFVHIPKTGGTSIQKAFRAAGCAKAFVSPRSNEFFRAPLQHMSRDVYTDVMDEAFYDYAFTVVRNPFDRAASEYKMKGLGAGKKTSCDDWLRTAIESYRSDPFCRGNHIRPQKDFVGKGIEVFKIEDGLDRPLSAAFSVLGLEPPESAPHHRRGSEERLKISSSTAKLMEEVYAEDFKTFGYAKDPSRSFEITD